MNIELHQLQATISKKSDFKRTTSHILYIILLLLFLADTTYSFKQHYSQPLDGDMAGGIVPAADVREVLNHPLGFYAIVNNQKYANPNKFFSHWIFKEYFTCTPILLQKFVSPVESVYLSCAIAKITIQVALIFLLAFAISNTFNFLKLEFFVAVILVAPLFQTNGYRDYMGIIDTSITYTFFYALPMVFLLLYMTPFNREFYHFEKIISSVLFKITWLVLAIIICLSGPLNPGVILIFSTILFISNFKRNYLQSQESGLKIRFITSIKMIPKNYWVFLLPLIMFSVYSLFLGSYNSINIINQKALLVLYSRLLIGFYYMFTQKIGFPILFVILIIDILLIRYKFHSSDGKKIINLIKWVGIFSILYILLLPFGGYRNYRPNVLRYDTMLPVTIGLIYVFGISSLYLLKNTEYGMRICYSLLLLFVLFIYTNADEAHFNQNKCEKDSLKAIASSTEKVIRVNDCNVLSWKKIEKPEDSELNCQLLYIWGITKDKKLYFNK